jgi:hypothetical protein
MRVPFSTGDGTVAVAVNNAKSADDEGLTRCIASECMAWRKGPQIGINRRGEKVDRDLNGDVQWHDTGYCGLAGKP